MVLIDLEPIELIYPAIGDQPERTEVRQTLFVNFSAGTYNRPESV